MSTHAHQVPGTDDPTPVRERLAELSRTHARSGDTRSAQLAAWSADISVLEQLLWDNGLGDAPDPDAQLAAVGGAVADALDAISSGASGDLARRTAVEVVELAREALMATFDESVHEVLAQAFVSLEHLTGPVSAGPGAVSADGRRRLGSASAEELVVELLAAAGDCMAVAGELAAVEEHEAAYRMSGQADAASFEAYLVAAASLAGDHELASAELRWALAEELTRAPYRPGTSLADSVAARRAQLLALLGSAEQGVLEQTFEPVPGPRDERR
jgi:hypothetical protein